MLTSSAPPIEVHTIYKFEAHDVIQTYLCFSMAALPRVVRLCRRGGKVVQHCDCYIGRAVKRGGWNLDASMWANPFKPRKGMPPGSTLAE